MLGLGLAFVITGMLAMAAPTKFKKRSLAPPISTPIDVPPDEQCPTCNGMGVVQEYYHEGGMGKGARRTRVVNCKTCRGSGNSKYPNQ